MCDVNIYRCRSGGSWAWWWCRWWGDWVWLACRTKAIHCDSVTIGFTQVRLCKPEVWRTAEATGISRLIHSLKVSPVVYCQSIAVGIDSSFTSIVNVAVVVKVSVISCSQSCWKWLICVTLTALQRPRDVDSEMPTRTNTSAPNIICKSPLCWQILAHL